VKLTDAHRCTLLPPRVLGLVVEWAARHGAELLQNWEAIENRRPLRKIEPLD
jgi:hypothetical protein